MSDDIDWPKERLHLVGVRDWIAKVLGCDQVSPPDEVLWVKSWGVTAKFFADDRPVVFKDACPAIYPGAANIYHLLETMGVQDYPRLLASEKFSGYEWTVFEFIEGNTVDSTGDVEDIFGMVVALAAIQSSVVGADLGDLPGYQIVNIPDELFQDALEQPAEIMRRFEAGLSDLREMAKDLSEVTPLSLDHPDVNPSNAIVRNSKVVLIDWEEAMVGCPILSVERILNIDIVNSESGHAKIKDIYFDRFALIDHDVIPGIWKASRCIAPLRRALEAREFARAMKRSDPHSKYTEKLIGESLNRLGVSSR